jgi:hypothetical protein
LVPLDRSNKFAALWGAFGCTVQASWQDGEGGRLERFVPEIAGEVVTGAEMSYSSRQRCFRGFEWRVQRKARLEEEGASTPM